MGTPTKEQVDRFVAHVTATRGPWYDASRRELHAFAVLSELGEYLEAIEQGQPRELIMLEAGDVLFHAVTLAKEDAHLLFTMCIAQPDLVALLRVGDTAKKEMARGLYENRTNVWLGEVIAFMAREDWPEVMALYERKKDVKRTVKALAAWQGVEAFDRAAAEQRELLKRSSTDGLSAEQIAALNNLSAKEVVAHQAWADKRIQRIRQARRRVEDIPRESAVGVDNILAAHHWLAPLPVTVDPFAAVDNMSVDEVAALPVMSWAETAQQMDAIKQALAEQHPHVPYESCIGSVTVVGQGDQWVARLRQSNGPDVFVSLHKDWNKP